ncbi:hypothetical protein WJX72_003937 [[Myrmecia] bisecta]|uniref:RSE1/DDB1/CPSF1 second beta-propeller domain-containing protein n=1 Tax=[Myrmecia] bisecta TaxID=41462 RepID=A0AAW1PNI2_9CHLO
MTVAPLDSALEVRPGVHAPPVDVNYILDLQFVPQPHATGSAAGVHHLALLHVNTQSWGAVASVQSIAWDPAGHLSLGPWTMRNIDPSTSLLCPVSKSPSSAQGPVTLPSVLCHLPDWVVPSETGEQQAVLFVGSHGGNSQLVGVPNDPTLPSGRGGAAPLVWPVLDAAFVDSLAPVQDAVVFHDPPGSREGRLLMCCGLAPSGTLRLARLAVGLQPAVTDGPRIPGRPQMTAVGAPGHSEIDAYIAFSFEAGSSTSLLRVSGTHFQQVQLEGLVYDSATLLLAALPNDRLVQVTPQEVRIVADDAAGQLLASWQPAQGPISGAAVHGRHLAVASGSAVFLLEVHDDDVMDKGDAGQPLHCRQQLDYIEQISALAWLDLSHQASGEPSADPWLAVGQWMTNDVVAGLSEVDLFWVPARGGAPAHVYARSDQSLLLRAVDQDIGTGCAMDHVEVVRVHGADGMTSITPIHTPELPASMAWLSTAGMLMFGALEHDLKLRWQTANLGDAPTHLAHDPSSGCAVVLTESPEGVSWLRVVHATSLRQVAGVQLAAGHQALAVCTAALPCSSVSASNPGEKPAATKEFVIVSSCLSTLEGQGESAEAASTSGRVSGDGLQRLTSVLSFFEVRVTAHEAGQQKRYELVLHGTFTVPALCHCLAGCADARSTYSNAQVLLLGCHDGQVRMYQAFVDDAAQAGPHSLASAVATLTRVPPLQPSGPGPNPQPTACGNGPASLPAGNGVGENGRQPDWRQRVTLRLLGQAGIMAGWRALSSLVAYGSIWRRVVAADVRDNDSVVRARRCMANAVSLTPAETLAGTNVSSLAAYGATVVAADFLGSVSVMRAAPGGPVPLLTVAADRTPLYAQALLAISDTLTLVAAHPYGLVLMERDSEAELRAEADKLKLDEAAFEAGRARPGEAFQQPHEAQGRAEDADVDVEGVARRAREAFIQPLRYVAACDRSQMITHFCRGRLGVQPEECSLITPDELRTLRAIHYEGLETSQDEIWPVATYDSFDGYIEHPRVAPKPRPGPSGQMDPLTPYDHVCYYNRPAAEWVPPSLGPGYRRDFDDDEDENADEPEDWVEQRFRMKMLMEDLVETAIDADLADALHAPKHKRLPLWLDAPDQLAGQLKAFTDAFVDR